MLKQIKDYIDKLSTDKIPQKRLEELALFAEQLKNQLQKGSGVNINFICTHNSRRSQFAQVWAQTMAYHYGVNASCYSGGLEVTACNPRTITALESNGFDISKTGDENPEYAVRFSEITEPVKLFSKLYSDDSNPASFIAVMTCDHADQNCPFIPNALLRIPLTYVDPKRSDDTDSESQVYLETSYEIASQMKYVFSLIQ